MFWLLFHWAGQMIAQALVKQYCHRQKRKANIQ